MLLIRRGESKEREVERAEGAWCVETYERGRGEEGKTRDRRSDEKRSMWLESRRKQLLSKEY